jgi:RNA polymerase sigma factor for flagellar operon FliA
MQTGAAKVKTKTQTEKPRKYDGVLRSPTAPKLPAGKTMRDVWVDYRATPTTVTRNFLVETYMHLVRYNAERIRMKLPNEVELDDLISSGNMGLMDAIDAFDLARNIKFETYCAPRIRGAILDELRAMDWVPRLVRSRTNKVAEATKQLEVEQGFIPTHEEVAERMQVPMTEFRKIVKDSVAVGVVSLSRKWFETDSSKDVREIDVVEDKGEMTPIEMVDRRDFWDKFLRGTNRAERLIVLLYYKEGMTMKEIGATLDLSESRVSQMHSSIILRLKSVYLNDADVLELLPAKLRQEILAAQAKRVRERNAPQPIPAAWRGTPRIQVETTAA